MHIPDGFLDTKTVITTLVLSLVGVGRALRELKTQLSPQKVPLMGLAAAFIFVAQMLNFPVFGGTSGHLLGAVLVSVLLGPSSAIIVMTVVIMVQSLIFADGGVLALGANIFNMGIIATVGGYYIYRTVSKLMPAEYGKLAVAAFAAWCSTVLAAICCAGELAWSGTVPWSMGFPVMTGVHMLIGVGEGLITTLVLAAVYKTRPDLWSLQEKIGQGSGDRSLKGLLIYGSLIIAGLVIFVLPFASPLPDGLKKVAVKFGFDSSAITSPLIKSPMADYHVPGIGSLSTATALAGIIGAVIVFIFSFVLAKAVFQKSNGEINV
ncbi:MAG: energy-coupling factor ABC transporter permease [Bacteroidota bacterium]